MGELRRRNRRAMDAALARKVDAALAAGQTDRAACAILDALGAEVFGFLVAVVGDPIGARAAYGGMVSRLTRELSRFRARCSLRTWVYSLAYRELANAPKSPYAGRRAPVIARGSPYRTMAVVNLAAVLRDRLDAGERQLLVLRIDRGLAWRDIAFVMRGDSASDECIRTEIEDLQRRFARLREKIQTVAARR